MSVRGNDSAHFTEQLLHFSWDSRRMRLQYKHNKHLENKRCHSDGSRLDFVFPPPQLAGCVKLYHVRECGGEISKVQNILASYVTCKPSGSGEGTVTSSLWVYISANLAIQSCCRRDNRTDPRQTEANCFCEFVGLSSSPHVMEERSSAVTSPFFLVKQITL